jgi:EAL domain-containing protein (putative c-di-GMP-specific phosphodiesterase class I)
MLRQNIGYELYTKLTCKLADKFKTVNELTDSRADLYYLDKGSFAAVASYSRYNMIYNFGRMLSDFVRAPFKLSGMEIMMDTRMCLINCPSDIDNVDAMIGFVNALEYRIHDADKLVIMSDISESKEFRMRNDMNSIIGRGISGHNFQMYYQPIYSLREKRFTCAEALIRLIDEEYGFVSPALFIPVAEQTGAIHHIGDYVIDAVCRFVSSDTFKELGLDYVEVNLSVAQCIESNLAEKFESVLKKYGVRSSQINLEITETSVDYDPAVTDMNIDKLSAQGFSFSLDDYGTGYSNIKRVVTLPLDMVKLDKCLVDDMDNESMWIVIRNTVDMLKSMKKKILVEGVETERAMEKFRDLGCDYIQGFFFSKPLPEREFVRFIRRSNV